MLIFVVMFCVPAFADLTDIEKLLRASVEANMIFTYVPRGLVVSFDEDVFFNENQDKVSVLGTCVLNQIGNVINKFDNLCVIEGHTNKLHPQESVYDDNWEISIVRANNIAIYLIRCREIKPEKIFSIGFGECMPFHDNVSYTGNLNNRIDFVFLEYKDLGYN